METLKKLWTKLGERAPFVKHLVILLGLLVVSALVIHVLLLLGTRHSAQRTVPVLTGMPVEQARQLARRSDLDLRVNDSLYVAAYEGGTVLDQLPEAGVNVKPGRTVYITINAHTQRMVRVPYVAGGSLRQAKNMLEVAGLGIEKIIYKPDMATNYVLEEYVGDRRITSASKLELPQGSGVTLHVGRSGYVATAIPKVVGDGLHQAKSRLWEQGFNIGKVEFDRGITLLNQKDARVYSQSPAAGRHMTVGTEVSLKLTLDMKKVEKQGKIADGQYRAGAEELQRIEQERRDSVARALIDSMSRANPVTDFSFDNQPAETPFADDFF